MMRIIRKNFHRIKGGISLMIAVSIMLSVVAISGLSLTAFASTSTAGQNIYINLNQNSSWKSVSSLNFIFTDSNGYRKSSSSAAVTNGVSVVAAPSGATRLQFSSNSGVSATFSTINTAVAVGYHRIFLNASSVSSKDNNSYAYATPYIHYYNSSEGLADSTWPGIAMTQIGSTSYYYADIRDSYRTVNFSNVYDTTNKYTNHQTFDLGINFGYSADYAYYDGSKWVNPLVTLIDFTDTANNHDLYNRATEYYVASDNSIIRSKYISPEGNDQSSYVTYQDIYVYNESWNSYSAIYATWDFSDPFETRTTLTATTINGTKVFYGRVPENATIKFHANSTDLKGASDQTAYPSESGYGSGDNTATYKITPSGQGWCKFVDLNNKSYDAIIGSNLSNAYVSDPNSKIVAVDATYFDYLSDEERGPNGYLWNLAYGWTETTGNSEGDLYDWWYQFDDFNKFISNYAAENAAWKYPLYFGNMFGGAEHFSKYKSKAESLTRFYYSDNYFKAINNSSPMKWQYNSDSNYYQSLLGLAYPQLNSKGNIQVANGVEMPYFSTDLLTNTNYAKVFKGYFPFRAKTDNNTGVTTYSFTSKNAQDNVYFKWDGHTPKTVNYGEGSSYGIHDAVLNFGGTGSNGYGIFPFNNTYSTQDGKGRVGKVSGSSVENLDYGFGIRLDIDFKVPQNGTLDGTSGGSPVTFNFTGDDDLWVYIGEKSDGSDGKLVLDLGGDHKEASGSINFKSMTATADNVFADYSTEAVSVDTNPVPDGEFWVKTTEQYFCLYVWQNTSKGTYLLPYNSSSVSSDGYAKFKTDIITTNTECCFCKWQNINDGKVSDGNVNISNVNRKMFNQNGTETTATTSTSSNTTYNYGHSVTTPFTVNGASSLDPNKTYHMTVFYMERGESESNFSVDFTMTPANNDLEVSKTLDTGDVVSAIAKDLKAKETYDYTISDGNTTSTGKSYYLNGNENSLVNNGFVLQDQDVADFDNTFKTGSDITVNESIVNNALTYETNWELYNRANGVTIKDNSATGSTQAEFKLENPDDKSAYAQLNLDYINTIITSDLSIQKKIQNNMNTKQAFDFTIKLDLDGSGSVYGPKAYPLEYVINDDFSNTYVAYNGVFTMQKDDKVTLLNIPVGATYTIEEAQYDNYVMLNNPSRKINGTIELNNPLITVTNVPVANTTTLEITKNLDNRQYTGDEFTYTIHGLSEMTITGGNTISTAGESATVSSATGGTVTFTGNSSGSNKLFAFVDSGNYRYVITESKSDPTTTDYIMDGGMILVNINYDSSTRTFAKTYYYASKDAISGLDTSSTTGSLFARFFTNSYSPNSTPKAFNNSTQKGSVTVRKTDQEDVPIEDTQFALIKVSGEGAADDYLDNLSLSQNSTHLMLDYTNGTGDVIFDDLTIFEDGSGQYTSNGWSLTSDDYTNGEESPQWYCLFEYEPAAGYNRTLVKQYFTLPRDGNYDITLEDVQNSLVFMPNASGTGHNIIFMIVGVAIMGSALMFGGVYYANNRARRQKRKYRARVRQRND